jgi:zinc protease
VVPARTLRVAGATSGTVRLGWRGPDFARTQDRRAVRAAMRVVSTRLSQELREQQGLTYTVSAGLEPLPGGAPGSWFGTTFEVAPDRAGPAVRAARAVFEAFARSGPTGSELAACLLGLKSDIARAHASAEYWSAVLVGLSARGVPLAEEEGAAEANARLTAADLKQAAARYTTGAARFELVVLPPLASAR